MNKRKAIIGAAAAVLLPGITGYHVTANAVFAEENSGRSEVQADSTAEESEEQEMVDLTFGFEENAFKESFDPSDPLHLKFTENSDFPGGGSDPKEETPGMNSGAEEIAYLQLPDRDTLLKEAGISGDFQIEKILIREKIAQIYKRDSMFLTGGTERVGAEYRELLEKAYSGIEKTEPLAAEEREEEVRERREYQDIDAAAAPTPTAAPTETETPTATVTPAAAATTEPTPSADTETLSSAVTPSTSAVPTETETPTATVTP
ncbi:MAG: hypothetical protein Q4B22_06235, partial [Eubacteriales bacterium]|nr:hypothetical protein [Eubacteriales bacterium]